MSFLFQTLLEMEHEFSTEIIKILKLQLIWVYSTIIMHPAVSKHGIYIKEECNLKYRRMQSAVQKNAFCSTKECNLQYRRMHPAVQKNEIYSTKECNLHSAVQKNSICSTKECIPNLKNKFCITEKCILQY